MENATKALLIAAALLMSVMLISVLVMFRSKIAGYFEAKHEAQITQQLLEFNSKFETYNGQTIRGNELISIMNRIIDYNNYESDIMGYERIEIEIDLKNHQNELKYKDESGSDTLVSGRFVENKINDNNIKRISTTSARLSSTLSISDTKLQKMSAEIDSIVDDASAADKEVYKITRAKKLTKILGYAINKDDNVDDIKNATYQYYQFTQFKRAMFKCKQITHNTENGRVNKMFFEVVLENDKIKLE